VHQTKIKIGFLSLPVAGHAFPMTALARKMQSRGHDAIIFGIPDVEPFARAANLRFISYGERDFPPGSAEKKWASVSKLQGLDVIRHTGQFRSPEVLRTALRELPEKVKQSGVQALAIDSVFFFGSLIAMQLGLPFADVCYVLNLDASGSTPPFFAFGAPDDSPEALARNRKSMELLGEYRAPITEIAKAHAQQNNIRIDWNDPEATSSKLAIISQTPKEFDFPISTWPSYFHNTGPFHDDHGREPIPFPWKKLNGKPLLYASLGTLVNGRDDIYRNILSAASTLSDVQMVLSVGRNVAMSDLGVIPQNTIVVRSAPQIELLKRASLCITHAGLNTTLESLAQGVPMVAIPISYDQPGVAERIKYHGVGEFVMLDGLDANRLRELVQRVRTYPSYRDKARYFQKVIAQTHGLDVAATVLERAFLKTEFAPATQRKEPRRQEEMESAA
jgi:zeaxanthin glucosyltransferase